MFRDLLEEYNVVNSFGMVWYGMVWRVNGVLCCVCVMVWCTALYSDLRHFYLLLNSTLHSSTVLYLFYFHVILISSFSSSFLLIFTLFFHFPFIISFFLFLFPFLSLTILFPFNIQALICRSNTWYSGCLSPFPLSLSLPPLLSFPLF